MVETIFRVVIILLIITIIIAVLGSTSLNYNVSFSNFKVLFTSFLHCICYIVPIERLLPIFVTVVGFTVFRISISLLKTIWSLFPLQG